MPTPVDPCTPNPASGPVPAGPVPVRVPVPVRSAAGLLPGSGRALDQLEVLARAWSESGQGPRLDGRLVPGLPPRLLTPARLRGRLAHPATTNLTRERTWQLLVTRARTGGQEWQLLAVWLLAPGLRRAAGRLTRQAGRDGLAAGEVEAELLTGLLVALAEIDPAGPRLARALIAAAYRQARRACRAEGLYASRHIPADHPAAPAWPAGHPDFLLAAAVRQQIISPVGADLIGETRLQHVPLAQAAATRGLTPAAGYQARWRAERALTGWLTGPDYDPYPAPARSRDVKNGGCAGH